MTDTPSRLERLGGRVVRLPWTWPLPAVAVQALVLLGSTRIWTDTVTVRTRAAESSTLSVAERYLVLLGLSAGAYWAMCLLGDVLFVGARVGMRTATEAEKGCVVALLRLALLTVLYASACTMLWDYAG